MVVVFSSVSRRDMLGVAAGPALARVVVPTRGPARDGAVQDLRPTAAVGEVPAIVLFH
jgi:hypothetical protein